MRTVPFSQFFIGVFALVIFVTSIHLYGGVDEFGAGFMPTVLSGLLFFFTALDGFIQCRKETKVMDQFTGKEWKAIFLIIVAVALFVWLLDILGFLISAIALLFCLMMIRRKEKVLFALVLSVMTASIIYYVFAHVLMVDLPSGFWQ
ncbi:tripartite tricarboxylate transporter TctB family protein [Vibrio salinus]|uniref:tripartite tricarboxylate transporter TctB family protein n=1 Tax=Vibrio salinus TaxID=2899784 RepID=UPI001E35C069|nr:tripartite tricarboxylate transporter TctB family protein [Vibrio salinus]MCE0494183.1 tripartite tricarboxylate transporter TctB family protein [Vibrio salinus]